MIFSMMNIKKENQPHVLKWGILSAIVLRVIFILFGVALLHLFHPVVYVFGIILFVAAYKMAFGEDSPIDYETNTVMKFISGKFNHLPNDESRHFFKKIDGKFYVTNLFLTLLMIESADVVFAVDSIPAVIAVTHDPFIIITSNIFAILGLRALYFALSGLADLFAYLKYGVAIILFYVGVKMVLVDIFPIPTIVSLIIICACLFISIILSIIMKNRTNLHFKNNINE